VRLDKFLFFARFTKTRALAQRIINDGHIRVDGRRVETAHAPLGVGSLIILPLHNTVRVIRVTALPQRRGPAREAQSCYCDVPTQTRIDEAMD
jgi:ribosome-associated heat shock protein Hsp15